MLNVRIVGEDWATIKLIANLEDIRMDIKMANRIQILDRLLNKGAITQEFYVDELKSIYKR